MRRSAASILLRKIKWVILSAAIVTFSASAEPLNVYIGQGQMPFAGGSEQSREGLFVDLARELCRRMQRECVYRRLPWRRVLFAVSADRQGIALNLIRTRARERNYSWLLKVIPSTDVLVSLDQPFRNLQDALQAGPVAVMAGTVRAIQLDALRQSDQRVVEVTDSEQAVLLLQAGRVIAWYESSLRAINLSKQAENSAALKFSGGISKGYSYIAGNLNLQDADRLQRQMHRAFSEMRRDGSWQKILDSYFGAEYSAELLRNSRSVGSK